MTSRPTWSRSAVVTPGRMALRISECISATTLPASRIFFSASGGFRTPTSVVLNTSAEATGPSIRPTWWLGDHLGRIDAGSARGEREQQADGGGLDAHGGEDPRDDVAAQGVQVVLRGHLTTEGLEVVL